MATLHQLLFIVCCFLPWAGFIYFAVSPKAPIFPNTVLFPLLEKLLPDVPLLLGCIRGMSLLLDTVLILNACFSGIWAIMTIISYLFVYLGE